MSKVKILVVEDENIVAKDIQSRLERLQYEVCGVVASGEEAIRQAKTTQPDLVLMDIMLRGKMDGIETAEHIRECVDAPVIYLTAFSDTHTLERAKATEPFGYVLKPFEERDLHVTIQMALSKHRMERSLRERQRWFATVLQCISDAVIATDPRGVVTFMNPLAETLTGWIASEAIGQDLTTVFRLVEENGSGAAEDAATKALRGGVINLQSCEATLAAKEATPIPIEQNATLIQDDRGRVLGVALVFRDIASRKARLAAEYYQAMHDQVTGLPNRILLSDRLEQAILGGHRDHRPVTLLVLDIAEFRTINETCGKYGGDLVLQQVGQRITDTLRRSDTVARLGHDVFAIVLPMMGSRKVALSVVERIVDAFAQPLTVEGRAVLVTFRVGVAFYPKHGEDADSLLWAAEMAKEEAKRTGMRCAIHGPKQAPLALGTRSAQLPPAA